MSFEDEHGLADKKSKRTTSNGYMPKKIRLSEAFSDKNVKKLKPSPKNQKVIDKVKANREKPENNPTTKYK